MTIAEQKAACETYQGMTEIPTDFEAVWRGRWAKAAPAGEVLVERLPFQNAQAVYQQWSVPAPNGRSGPDTSARRGRGPSPRCSCSMTWAGGFEAGTT